MERLPIEKNLVEASENLYVSNCTAIGKHCQNCLKFYKKNGGRAQAREAIERQEH